jgi:flagellar protein FlaJ
MKDYDFSKLKESILKQKKIVKEIISSKNYYDKGNAEEKKIILDHLKSLMENLVKTNKETNSLIEEIHLAKPLESKEERYEQLSPEKIRDDKKEEKKEPRQIEISTPITLDKKYSKKEMKPDKIERETFKRVEKQKQEEKISKSSEIKNEVSSYVKFANKFFSRSTKKLVDDKTMENLERDLVKSNMQFTGQEYLSMTLMNVVVSIFISGFLILFFLFFNIGPDLPIITRTTESVTTRLIKIFWLIFVVPIATLFITFFYPSMEKNSSGNKMDQEMPFATIHMSAISGSMINPKNIFEIIISTNEYPHLSKQFTKLINEINIYGYDIVSALRNGAYNSPSKKLSELYAGLATTINSGGDLAGFFEKRSETLLFEYGLEKEKRTKAAETFMDIYISMVIAAPMILMILLMMMKISGLGIALSTSTITLIMIVAVTVINIIFISVLEVRK